MHNNKMQTKRMEEVLKRLREAYQGISSGLNFSNPFELLIATVLSAQCTDQRVNVVTHVLFSKYPTPQHYLEVTLSELEKDIFSTGFYRNKARNIQKCCQALIDFHSGEVPSKLEDLTRLAGVGRKTANVVLGNAFGVPGIAVDTHVKRISKLLGFSKNDDPDKIELKLMKIVPQSEWTNLGHLFANHGRNTCIARHPKCEQCTLSDVCPSVKKYSLVD